MNQQSHPLSVCHLSTAHPVKDVRIFYKECLTLASAGFKTHLVVQHTNSEEVGGVHIVRLKKIRGRIGRVWASLTTAPLAALKTGAKIIHFHDPELLLAGVGFALIGKKVIYDVHEDYSAAILSRDWMPILFRKSVGVLFYFLEKVCSFFFSGIVVATPSIGEKFSSKKTVLVQNFPLLSDLIHENTHQRNANGTIASYVGVISKERGLMEMIEAVELLPEKLGLSLHIAGDLPPELCQAIEQKVKKNNRFVFKGLISRAEVGDLLSQSLVGLVLFHPCPNHTKSQPNKLFEYMAAGIPVIASDFPHWKKFVLENQCGLCVDPLSPIQIAKAIEWIMAHPDQAEEMGNNGRILIESRFNWETESRKLLDLYHGFGGSVVA